MIVIEYLIFISIITVLVMSSIWLVLNLKQEINLMREELTGLRNELKDTQEIYRKEIRQLIDGFKGLLK